MHLRVVSLAAGQLGFYLGGGNLGGGRHNFLEAVFVPEDGRKDGDVDEKMHSEYRALAVLDVIVLARRIHPLRKRRV